MSTWDGGHVRQGCRGRWVEITTLADPYPKEKCVECRAVRRRLEDDPQVSDEERQAAQDWNELRDLGSVSGERERFRRPWRNLIVLMLVALALAGLAFFTT